jgi:hypothetical protein
MDPVESTYSVITAALVTQVSQRQRVLSAATKVLDFIPVKPDEIRTDLGTYEVIGMGEAEGTFDNVVFTDGGLRFDEVLDITVLLEVHGTDSMDTATVAKRRVNQLLYELLAELSAQASWDKAQLGLDVFDYVWVTPAAQAWNPGRLQQTGVYACACELQLEARARRNFL